MTPSEDDNLLLLSNKSIWVQWRYGRMLRILSRLFRCWFYGHRIHRSSRAHRNYHPICI